MNLLVLGGTIFLGRAIVEEAVARRHTLTLFNRGKSAPGAYPDLDTITGDRDGGLSALGVRRFDAVIDTCGYVPRVVRASAEALAPRVEHYTFVSSGSVYADLTARVDERAPVGKLEDEGVETVDGETYGPLKALSERAVHDAMDGRVLNVRAGLIVGPHDPSDRFTYWPCRIAEGGDVLAPDRKEMGLQFIDVRDLAAWIVRSVEARLTGTFNATGPTEPLAFEPFLNACREATGSGTAIEWVDEAFLIENGVKPWMGVPGLPLWIPGAELAMDCRKAFAAGLTTRSLAETVRDTLEWARTRPIGHVWRSGLPREREAELLAAARARRG